MPKISLTTLLIFLCSFVRSDEFQLTIEIKYGVQSRPGVVSFPEKYLLAAHFYNGYDTKSQLPFATLPIMYDEQGETYPNMSTFGDAESVKAGSAKFPFNVESRFKLDTDIKIDQEIKLNDLWNSIKSKRDPPCKIDLRDWVTGTDNTMVSAVIVDVKCVNTESVVHFGIPLKMTYRRLSGIHLELLLIGTNNPNPATIPLLSYYSHGKEQAEKLNVQNRSVITSSIYGSFINNEIIDRRVTDIRELHQASGKEAAKEKPAELVFDLNISPATRILDIKLDRVIGCESIICSIPSYVKITKSNSRQIELGTRLEQGFAVILVDVDESFRLLMIGDFVNEVPRYDIHVRFVTFHLPTLLFKLCHVDFNGRTEALQIPDLVDGPEIKLEPTSMESTLLIDHPLDVKLTLIASETPDKWKRCIGINEPIKDNKINFLKVWLRDHASAKKILAQAAIPTNLNDFHKCVITKENTVLILHGIQRDTPQLNDSKTVWICEGEKPSFYSMTNPKFKRADFQDAMYSAWIVRRPLFGQYGTGTAILI